MVQLITYLDLKYLLRFEDPVQLQVKSYISDGNFSKSQHLASYVSRHNAMAYGTAIACEELVYPSNKALYTWVRKANTIESPVHLPNVPANQFADATER